MGKGELGELQPFDLVVSLMLADLATLPMEDFNAPLIHGIIAIATITFLQCLMSYTALKSNIARKVISGRPTIIIDHGKFNVKEMKKLRINVNDILGQMRQNGYYNMEDVDYVIMETNGDVSIIAADNNKRCKRIPISVILDGRVMTDNLEEFNINEDNLYKEVEKQNLKVENIIYGFVDESDKFIFYRK
jgi:uncharacterized membrane protein YcaP (DUF421 family)